MINDINILYAAKKYKELAYLKKALGINKNKEVSISIILDMVKEHNKKEVFLLQYIIKEIKNMPSAIKKQFKCISDNENNETFNIIYEQTEKMFSTNEVFKRYYKEIYNDLSLKIASNRHFFNSLIYEIAYKEISDKSVFSEKNSIINMYLLKKWIQKYEMMPTIGLSLNEKKVIEYLITGYTDSEIISLNLIPECSKNKINNIINVDLPEKYSVENITQVLALYFYKMNL